MTVTVRVAQDMFPEETVTFLLRLLDVGARLAATDPSCRLDEIRRQWVTPV